MISLKAAFGNDLINGGADNDAIDGERGIDTVFGGDGDDLMLGGEGNDNLDGGNDNDDIYGEDGGDAILGGLGDDTLRGGKGNDTLDGGEGSDHYLVEIEEGQDSITDSGSTGEDTLRFGKGVTSQKLINEHQLTINGSLSFLFSGIERIDFNNGSVWRLGEDMFGDTGDDTFVVDNSDDVIHETESGGLDTVQALVNYVLPEHVENLILNGAEGINGQGNSLNNAITGNNAVNVLAGYDGADALWGNAGNDTLDGGADADYLDGGEGNDVYQNTTGNDTIYDIEGHNIIELTALAVNALSANNADLVLSLTDNSVLTLHDAFFGMSALLQLSDGQQLDLETLFGTSLFTPLDLTLSDEGGRLYGGAGDDRLSGSIRADTLSGQLGNDVLIGDAGSDVLSGGIGNDTLNGGADADRYLFETGWGHDVVSDYDPDSSPIDVIEFGAGVLPDNILVSRDNFNLVLRLENSSDTLTVANYFYPTNTIENIRFADGTTWDFETLKTLISGTDGDDRLYGYDTADIIDGLNGNDGIYGLAGNDTLIGGNGDDVIDGGDGRDVIFGGNGNDVLAGGTGGDRLKGGDGNDRLYGGQGDTLDGGAGDDTFESGEGNELYLFEPGFGNDVIYYADGGDTLQFGVGINANDLQARRTVDGLVIGLLNCTDQITLQTGSFSTDFPVIRFADGSVLDANAIIALTNTGSSDDDVLVGSDGDDELYGLNGNDLLYGGFGNDTLSGGNGDDVLYGGWGMMAAAAMS
ncbi:calcium-binding protein [Methylocucumis oryzae]|uniref:Haemolysin-type calcium binding-related domain-containing protein n=1 Tax=Methylocucumis oryzae TaxID=1632867 RepID=A0A0F3IPD8_9GAMM|nr:calcium-binding protein [Methylocucumis oryzae]KJV07464.1 hypothetical protein VZ94_04630 [Methylocucumis oryzae]